MIVQDGRPIRAKRELIQPSKVEPIESTSPPEDAFIVADDSHLSKRSSAPDLDEALEGSLEPRNPGLIVPTIGVVHTQFVEQH